MMRKWEKRNPGVCKIPKIRAGVLRKSKNRKG